MTRLRLTTAGESHGPAEVCIVEGLPADLVVRAEDIDKELARRQRGHGRGGRMGIEQDRVQILAGVRLGRTLGSPVALLVPNADHSNWMPAMQPEPSQEEVAAVTVPRPGHADMAGVAKYGFADVRDVLERASARETVCRVAAGALAKVLLREFGVEVRGRVTRIGQVVDALPVDYTDPGSVDWSAVDESDSGFAQDVETPLSRQLEAARESGDSLGGVFEIWAWTVCPGIGSYQTAADRLDGRLCGAVASIPAVKGVEIGRGFGAAELPGSAVHDPIVLEEENDSRWVTRSSNYAGGLEGGVTNGMPLVVRAAMKPIPTLTRPLASVDLGTMEAVTAHRERSDTEAVSAARVVAEAVVAFELARAYLEKFGGDSLADVLASYRSYLERLSARGLWQKS